MNTYEANNNQTDTKSNTTDLSSLPTFRIPNYGKVLIGIFWLSLVTGFWIYANRQDVSPIMQLANTITAMKSGVWGIAVLFLAYLLRPFVLLPVTLLSLLAGYLYGAVGGFLFVTVALIVSSLLIYWLGWVLQRGETSKWHSHPLVQRFQSRSFETVLISRLMFVPGDIVNYLCGFFKIDVKAFVLASLIGGSPGAFMVVLAGAAIEGDFVTQKISIKPTYLLVSFTILISSLLISRWLHKRGNNDGMESIEQPTS